MSKSNSRSIKIPLTLDYSSTGRFSEKELVIAVTSFAVTIILVVILLALNNANKGLNILGTNAFYWIALSIIVLTEIWILREFVLREAALKRMLYATRANNITDLHTYWKVFDVQPTGEIKFYNGDVARIVKLVKGSMIGKSDSLVEHHILCKANFLNAMLLEGFKFSYYSLRVKDPNLDQYKVTEEKLSHKTGTPMFWFVNEMVRALRSGAEAIADTEYEYFLFRTRDASTAVKFDATLKTAISYLSGSLFSDIEILDSDGVYKFAQEYYHIGYIQIRNLFKFEDATELANMVQVIAIEYSEPSDVVVDEEDSKQNPEDYSNFVGEIEELLQYANSGNKRDTNSASTKIEDSDNFDL